MPRRLDELGTLEQIERDKRLGLVDPTTGLRERRPGQVHLVENNRWGVPEQWVSAEEYEEKYNDGWKPAQMWAAALPWALGGGQALAGALSGGGAAASSSAASSSIPSITATSGVPAGLPGAVNMAGNSGILGSLGSAFKGKIDPTALMLGGLSALSGGGDEGGDPRQSFHKGVSPAAGALVDPIQSLYNFLNATDRLGQFLNTRLSNGYNLRSSVVQPGPKPVSIPGLPFQIGGGFGTDPALLDPSLLMSQQVPGSPAYSTVNTPPGSGGGSSPAAPRRRSPQ